MPTFREQLMKDLEDNGLFPNQVEEVMVKIEGSAILNNMVGRWDSDIAGYPDGLYGTVFSISKTVVLEYIDENCPMAWFRPMFLPNDVRDALFNQVTNKQEPVKVTKFNAGHFPVGTIARIKLPYAVYDDRPEEYDVNVMCLKYNGHNSIIIITDEPDPLTSGHVKAVNISHVVGIVKRGEGAVVLNRRYGSDSNVRHITTLSRAEAYGIKKHHSQYFSDEPKSLIFVVANQYETPDMLVDYNKLYGILYDRGMIKKIILSHNSAIYISYILCNKKKLKKVIKQVINKCLLNRVKAQRKEDEENEAEYFHDLELEDHSYTDPIDNHEYIDETPNQSIDG